MIKKLITFLLVALMAFEPFSANANDLSAAFGNLLGTGAAGSVNSPGFYQSGARNSFSAGGLEMRVPRTQNMPQLFSATPPRITAGCNGISAHFGGFSFISGAEFEKLLKSIASGAALGFVSMLVMKVLCPMCEAIVQFLKTLAQQAARLAKDACQWGRELARSMFDEKSSNDGDKPTNVCGTTVMASGTSKDWIDAMANTCTNVTTAIDTLLGENSNAQTNPQDKGQLYCENGLGNVTWARLKAFDMTGTDNTTGLVPENAYRTKLMLMNLLGVDLGPVGTIDASSTATASTSPGASCEAIGGGKEIAWSATKAEGGNYCPPALQPDDMIGLFMCGAPSNNATAIGNTSKNVQDYCKTYFDTDAMKKLKEKRVYYCDPKDKENCLHVKVGDSSNIAQGEGFLIQVNKLLMKGVEAVRYNKAMPKEVVSLMQVAPYPLYQAINAAAVYPAAAGDLVDAMSILVAETLAVSYLDDALRIPGKDSGAKGCLSKPQAEKILQVVGSMRAANRERLKQIAQNITTQEVLSEQIRQVNLAIQRQVMSEDMLNQGKFAQSMSRALSPSLSKSETSSVTPPAATTP